MAEQLSESSTVFKFKGGISIGSKWWCALNLPWPLATISIASNDISISYLGSCVTFPRESISNLELFRKYLVTGVMLTHTEQRNAKFVLFSTLAARRVLAHAEYLGYPVKYK